MEVVNNQVNGRFEIREDNLFSELQYRISDGAMYLMHTQVAEEMSGQGIGSLLIKTALGYAKKQELKIVAYCPFSVGYIKRHPEYLELIDQSKQDLDRFN